MKICIMGDSWGCGVWDKIDLTVTEKGKGHGVVHKGLEFFLSKNHSVTNISAGGIGNIQAAFNLEKALNRERFDLIFWFVTDPLRDLNIKWLEKDRLNFNDLVEENNRLLRHALDVVQALNIRVQCIGGAGTANPLIIKDYSNLHAYIPSLSEYLLPNYKQPIVWTSWQWINEVKNNTFDPTSLDKILECRSQQEALYNCKELFWPDGCHPNLKGHTLLYEKIRNDFNL